MWEGFLDEVGFLLCSDQRHIFVVRVCFVQDVECIARDVACYAGASFGQLRAWISDETYIHEELWGHDGGRKDGQPATTMRGCFSKDHADVGSYIGPIQHCLVAAETKRCSGPKSVWSVLRRSRYRVVPKSTLPLHLCTRNPPAYVVVDLVILRALQWPNIDLPQTIR